MNSILSIQLCAVVFPRSSCIETQLQFAGTVNSVLALFQFFEPASSLSSAKFFPSPVTLSSKAVLPLDLASNEILYFAPGVTGTSRESKLTFLLPFLTEMLKRSKEASLSENPSLMPK